MSGMQVQSETARSGPTSVQRTTRTLQDAIDRAADAGGGRVTITPGVHETGALRLRSRVELHLEAGAVLRFVADPALYPPVGARWEGAATTIHSPCIYARDASDISITGRGEIDGGGAWWWDAFRAGSLSFPRPTLVGLHGCSRVEISGVTLRDSPAWTVHPLLCDDVRITGIRIINPPDSPNTDGIDPESCRNVRSTDRGFRIKSRRGRGGTVSDVRVYTIVMDRVMCPLVINPFYFCGPDGKAPIVSDRTPQPVDAGTPRFRGIHLAHITATNVTSCAAWVSGLPEAPIDDLTLDDFVVSFAPDATPVVPAMADGVPAMASAGVHAQFATGLRIVGLRVTGAVGPVLVTDGTASLETRGGALV